MVGILAVLLVVAAAAFFFYERYTIGKEMRENLPQLDGSLTVYGLAAPVTRRARRPRRSPHPRHSLDDLVFAQGFVTAQDRLWQMDLLRRHAAGELAAILGRSDADARPPAAHAAAPHRRRPTPLPRCPPTRSTGSKSMHAA